MSEPRPRQTPTLQRVAFKTSRLGEFVGQRELTAQTGHRPQDWPLVILKELVDNALDECEEAEIAPEITVEVSTSRGEIAVSDNGRGLPAETLGDTLDYSCRVSSREAYVSPTRGAQGNALKTILAMLSGERGETKIESRGIAHHIVFAADRIRQEPQTLHTKTRSLIKNGTSITVHWPDSACSILAAAKAHFLQIADDFRWINRRLRIRVEWNGLKRVNRDASNLAWEKWRACDQTSAHWYDLGRLERYITAHVGRDHGRDRAVREFISKLRGFSGSAKQKLVLDDSGLARAPLSSLFTEHGVRKLIPQDDVIEKPARRPIKERLIAKISDAFDKEPANADLPADLSRQIEECLEQNLELLWDEVVAPIISGETAPEPGRILLDESVRKEAN
jgi:hypothetical protein